MKNIDPKKTHFGYREVPLQEKRRLVGEVFSSVAENYDLMNDLMSFGVHRYWKKRALAMLDVSKNKIHKVLDLAGGTGDLSMLLADKLPEGSQIVLADINDQMVRIGRDRRIDQGYDLPIDYVLANAEQLPYPDACFDRVIIGFGLRNVTNKQQALDEMFRVLSPRGKIVVLEFSKLQSQSLSVLYDWYSFSVLPYLGKIVAGDADSYRYLVESIRQHPHQHALLSMLEKSGFQQCDYENFLQGVVAIHSAIKPEPEPSVNKHQHND